ncbi:MAG: MoxR family ATPase [Sandaracinaceae bacterium]|nr:MoxR family ATPase [Sandaracinaceae bacterium]
MTTPPKPAATSATATQPGAAQRPPSARGDHEGAPLSVAIGPRVLEVLDVAYRARRAVLLEGPTGIGKSQIVAQFAARRGIEARVLDLSLLEPPDLVGLPVLEGGRTRYACPAELPTEGRGVLLLEELNRAEIPVMQPALQLLSARRLHGYELPPGWMCLAAINPEEDDYQVHTLDPALRARFLVLRVHADRDSWLAWAVGALVHPAVVSIVRDHDDAFDGAPPRSWAYASDVLHALEGDELHDESLLRILTRGFLPAAWSDVLSRAVSRGADTFGIDVAAFLEPGGGGELAARVRELELAGRADVVAAIAVRMARLLASPDLLVRAAAGTLTFATLEADLACFPGDLRVQCLRAAASSSAAPRLLEGLGHELDPSSYAGSTLSAEVRAWRARGELARVALVVRAATSWLDEPVASEERSERAARGRAMIEALVRDAGPLADELRRRLAEPVGRAT